MDEGEIKSLEGRGPGAATGIGFGEMNDNISATIDLAIVTTYATTPTTPPERIGKVYAAAGPWGLTNGVRRLKYDFRCDRVANLSAYASELAKRIDAGTFAVVMGWPISTTGTMGRLGRNFTDEPRWILELDFDGLAAVDGRPIDRPKDFGDIVIKEALKRLPAAFRDAECICYGTSSTGLPFNAKGEPANGLARFRLIFWLTAPATLALQARIVRALKKLPGLECLDAGAYSLAHFFFIARPVFPAGMVDPIAKPVRFHKAKQAQVDLNELMSQIDIGEEDAPENKPRGAQGSGDRALLVDPELRLTLVKEAVAAIRNDLDRDSWIGFAHILDGTLEGDPEAEQIFYDFSAREVGPDGTLLETQEWENARAWETRGAGHVGYRHLLGLLSKQKTQEAEAAIEAMQTAGAQACFPVLTDEEIAEEIAEAAEMARKANGPTIADVRAAAEKLKGGVIGDARAVFELLAQVKDHDAADEDSVIEAVRFVLGKNARVPTLRTMIKQAAKRVASGASGVGGSGGGAGGSAPPSAPTTPSDFAWFKRMNTIYAIIRDRKVNAVFDLRGTELGLIEPVPVPVFHLLFANRNVKAVDRDGRTKMISWSRLWLAGKRREYMTAGDYPIGEEPRGAYNLWQGLAVTPKAGKWPTIKVFLLKVICAGSLTDYAYLLKLIQWKVQNPTKNPEVAISLQGRPGVGKGSFGLLLQTIFGLKRFRLFGRPDDVASRFNADAEGKMVLFYDEVVFAPDPRIRGKLKSEITEEWTPIEHKGVNTYWVLNLALRIFASNEVAPIAIDLDDRRVFVLVVSDIRICDQAYFKALRQAFAGDEMAAFVHDALEADLSTFEDVRRNPPKTKAKMDLADATAKPEHEFLRELLELGAPPEGSSVWGPQRYPREDPDPPDPWRDGKVTIERDAAHNAYLAWLKKVKPHVRPVNAAELDRIIQQVLGAAAFHSEKVWSGKKTRRMTLVASLSDCRDAYDKHTRHKREWDGIAPREAGEASDPI
jgi:hypothetical protein